MAQIGSFLGIFYIVLSLILLLLFYFEGRKSQKKDLWYQIFYFIGFIAIFMLLIHYTYFQSNIDIGYTLDQDSISLSNININSYTFNGDIEINNSDYFFVTEFLNINENKEEIYESSNFCFYYNNTADGNNVLRVTDGYEIISDPTYLKENTSDYRCIEISPSFVLKHNLLGLICLDCSETNKLYIKSGVGDNINLFKINESDIESYLINSESPPIFWIETRNKPVEQINQNFELFLKVLWVFVLMFVFRFIYKLVKEEVYDDFNNMY